MKILYATCNYSPLKYSDGSSTDYDLYHAFLSNGASVEIVGPFKDNPGIFERVYRRLHRLFSKRRFAKHSLAFLKKNAQEINKVLDTYHPDVIFSYFSAPLVYVKTRIPIVYAIDTTLKGMQPNWTLFSYIEYKRMLKWEQNVIRKSAAVITWSRWSADILQNEYAVMPDKITYLPRPASLPEGRIPKEIKNATAELVPLNLLLVGRDYKRKGIDIAIQVVDLLNRNGISTTLRIVGLSGKDTQYVRFYGVYDKSKPAELAKYIDHYRWAHFLIHPARFEAAGIVPSEAAAFGVPTITNSVGGLATTVEDQVSGIVLPKHSDAQRYFDVLQYYVQRPGDYLKLRKSTKQRYEREVNWKITGKRIFNVIKSVVDAHI